LRVFRILKDPGHVQIADGIVGYSSGGLLIAIPLPERSPQDPCGIVRCDECVRVIRVREIAATQIDVRSRGLGSRDGLRLSCRSEVDVPDEARYADLAVGAYGDGACPRNVPADVVHRDSRPWSELD